jgi:hypothetical protein
MLTAFGMRQKATGSPIGNPSSVNGIEIAIVVATDFAVLAAIHRGIYGTWLLKRFSIVRSLQKP